MTGRKLLSLVLGLVGGLLGGIAGYYAFVWIKQQQELYALVLPGSMIGIGCGLFALDSSRLRGLLCGLAALLLGLRCEWRFWPFKADESFLYLVTHAYQLKLLTQIMIVAGGLMAYWCGQGSMGNLPGPGQ